MGETDTSVREEYEKNNLKIPSHYDSTDRPIYGTLNWGHGVIPYHTHLGGAPSYGDPWYELKPHVRERTTFTPDDSFSTEPNETFTHAHLDKLAHQWQLNNTAASFAKVNDHIDKHPHAQDTEYNYAEAQIHGGVYLDKDVHALHLTQSVNNPKPHMDIHMEEAVKMGRKYGFKVMYHTHHKKNDGTIEYSVKVLHDPEEHPAVPAKPKPPRINLTKPPMIKMVPEVLDLVKAARNARSN